MITSGSSVAGIDPALFGLPAGTAIRFDPADAALQPFFPAYAVLDSDTSIFKGGGSWMLPGWAQIWIVLTEAPIGVQVRNRHYGPLGQAVLYGPTSRAMPIHANGGVSIVIEISPVGWARWFAGAAAEDHRDRLTPLDQFWPADWVNTLIAALHASDREGEVKGIIDDFLLARLPKPNRSEARVAEATAVLADLDLSESGQAAQRLGIGPQALLRLSRRNFGYGPKLLMRRTRFLNALTGMMLANTAADSTDLPPGYHDMPHFLRDGADFLGMTPRRFLGIEIPYLVAAMRARQQIIGTPWSLLDPLGRDRFL